jgi:hypothetical protein
MFREAFEAGRIAVGARSAELGIVNDPAGQNDEQERLRAPGKWRFVLIRGIAGWGVPMFLWLVLSNFSEDLKSAYAWHQPIFQHLLHPWIAAFFMSAFLGMVVGVLAWRRVTSEVWPGAKPNPESSITRLGPLGPNRESSAEASYQTLH